MATVNQVDQQRFQQMLAADPTVQSIIKSVWGDTPVNQRPSDTPKNLEAANKRASQQISAYLKAQGVQLPSHTFINPRTASLEAEHGWAGLPTAAKIAIIGGAAAGGLGLAGSLGAFGGAAGAGAGSGAASASALPSLGVTGGLSAGALPTIAGTAGAGAAGAAGAAGTGLAGTLGHMALSRGITSAIPAAASLIRGLHGGGGGNGGTGATLQDLLPMLMPLLQQSQQASSQNYALQQRRYLMTDPGAASLMPGAQVPEGALPLQEMVAKMTANILPNNARGSNGPYR